ncbi:MAG TPA: glycosyltransferase family 4 protein [Candidatus Sulfotelmatobacter sp.]|nr:glycosyltransferase family 4 protein [Candidatus Sulfotelmatobacter sp.]
MKLLFVHQNFPGQFKHICRVLAAQGRHQVVFLTKPNDNHIAGIQKVVYTPQRAPTPNIHHYIGEYENGVLHGQAVVREVLKLRQTGFVPDVMIGHNGWGETLFLKDVFPKPPLLSYFEFFYRSRGADVGFDPEFETSFDDLFRVRAKNSINLLGMDAADWGLSPTEWQRSRYPDYFRPRISVIHEGVDTDTLTPKRIDVVALPNGRTLPRNAEIVTYVSRNLEPYRGFHVFMRALPEILRRRPRAHVLILGGDEVSYGRRLPAGDSYRKRMLAEVTIDPERVHFLGRIPYDQFVGVLHASSVHVYLTYPFVLSWSMLEAMSCGCLVIGSATPPVQEVIRDRENGLLVDFFSTGQIADRVDEVLDHPDRMAALRVAARQTIIDRYDLRRLCLPRFAALINRLVAGEAPEQGWPVPRPELVDVPRA